jgi:hypothetical protein
MILQLKTTAHQPHDNEKEKNAGAKLLVEHAKLTFAYFIKFLNIAKISVLRFWAFISQLLNFPSTTVTSIVKNM